MDGEESRISDNVTFGSNDISVDDLLSRCRTLLEEIQLFRDYLVEHKKEKEVEIRHFHNAVLSEQKSIEKFLTSNPTAERTTHALRSSNLRFHSAVWDAAKNSSGLVTFSKRFYWETPPSRSSKRNGKPQKRGALVDVVADDGEEWIKVSTVTEKRLLFELAKQGWEAGESSSSSDSEDVEIPQVTDATFEHGRNGTAGRPEENDEDKIELIRLAQDLQKASRAARVRYRHPKVHFVLPNITSGNVSEIDGILSTIRSTGAITTCGALATYPYKPLSEVFPQLLPAATRYMTSTVNIDCTILLALVSDLSHYNSESIPLEATSGAKNGQPHPAIQYQLKTESEEQLLPSVLYPLLQGRKLVCTALAAQRMREIVNTIGTYGEKARTDIFISSTSKNLHSRLASITHYSTPSNLQLPIHIIDTDIELTRLPSIATKVTAHLTDINKSVFLFGWQEGYTTVSSNRAVVKTLEHVFEEERSEEVGPDVWLVGTARSLVGKERGRG